MEDMENLVQKIVQSVKDQSMTEFNFEGYQDKDLSNIVEPQISHLAHALQQRLRDEFLNMGPIEPLLADESISEILVNSKDDIWFERQGCLHRASDNFFSSFTYQLFLNKILARVDGVIDKENPILDRPMDSFRICVIDECLTLKSSIISIRRHPQFSWTLEKLKSAGWCNDDELCFFQSIIEKRKRFLIIGPTGCGKTSVINALLRETGENCRSIVIEDTAEISSINSCSLKLVTRLQRSQLSDITQSDLVKSSLRLRPDRIIMGEIRGTEAKDFLMALSTGHDGSFGSLHASDPHQALIRLEMLIQMGAPQWSLDAIRKLIFLSLDGIIVLGKETNGQRIFKGAYQITSLETSGFLIDRWIA
ncbi:MAG: CpaF family protein [Bdellovibrionaceae bacterium]|nr:CpaF family protein [Pseudobdellovibrionaceae bacterium]